MTKKRTQERTETHACDLISRQAAIALADKLKDDLPDDERISDMVMAHNEGIMEYQTALSLLPTEPEIITCKNCKWWTKQQDSMQGRCALFRHYPTGYWWCAAAKRRRDEQS